MERLRREDAPRDTRKAFRLRACPGLSREVVQRLLQVSQETLGQASRIPGMTRRQLP